MFKHILLATDGSDLSLRAVKAGLTLARTLGARVTGLHVYPARFSVYYGELAWIDDRIEMTAREACQKEGNKFLDQLASMAASEGVAAECKLLEGEEPWKSIIETAERQRCDLIVMAAHGRHGLSALVLGSETNKVLTHSKIPVLVYR